MEDNEDFTVKRKVPRRKIYQKVGVLSGGKYQVDYAHEVGEGGMLISSSRVLSKGQRVVITFSLPGVEKAILKGIIRYEKQNPEDGTAQYGIEFDNVSFGLKRLIRAFVASRAEDEVIAREVPFKKSA